MSFSDNTFPLWTRHTSIKFMSSGVLTGRPWNVYVKKRNCGNGICSGPYFNLKRCEDGDYSNSLSLSNVCELSWSWIPNSLPEFVFSSACSMAWTSGKNPPGMNFSLVCRVQSGNVLSMKNIRDRPYCCNNYIYFNPETQIFLKWERPHSAHLCGIDFNFVIGDDSLWCFLSDRLTRRHE